MMKFYIIYVVISYGCLLLSIIMDVIFCLIAMPPIIGYELRREQMGEPIVKRTGKQVFESYNINKPLIINKPYMRIVDFSIKYGNIVFYLIFAITILISAALSDKPAVLIPLAIVVLYCVFQIIHITIGYCIGRLLRRRMEKAKIGF